MGTVSRFTPKSTDPDTLGGRLSRTREALGLSVHILARRAGVRVRTLEQWESDRAEPPVDRLATLAGCLGVEIVWLMHGIGPAPEHDLGPDPLAAIAAQLEKLTRMHEDTGRLIARIQREVARLEDDG